MPIENRGTLSQFGPVMAINNAFVEEAQCRSCSIGHLLISYTVPTRNEIVSMETVRLNINRNTRIITPNGQNACLCSIRSGSWIDAVFSSRMTRSIPPQSNAFIIIANRRSRSQTRIFTGRIASIDLRHRFLYTGNPNDVESQIRFVISNQTVILDRNGTPVPLSRLRPGQRVRIVHSNAMTASIPPQTAAFYIQQL